MRIGIVCFSAIGGSSTVAAALASHLVTAGHTVFLLAPARPQRLPADSGALFRAMPDAGNPLRPGSAAEVHRLARAIAVVAAEEHLDVVHAHYANPHAVAAVAAREMLPHSLRPRVVTTLHGTDVTADSRVAPAISGALLGSDGLSAVSPFLADTAARVCGIDRPVVIPNFVEPASSPSPSGSSRSQCSKSEHVLLHVSTLRPVKRAVDCVEILARVQRRVPSRLQVVGDGPDRDAMRTAAARLGVADTISFAGTTASVDRYLAQADVLLLPSASEAFGMAALEAMAAGVPVVGSRVGGLTGLVAEGVCGRLLPVGDLDGMAAAACELLEQPRLAAAYADAGRRLARECFAPAGVIAAYCRLYDQARASRSARLSPVAS
jgi:N-acetyl-alpha-D-glucosaminyl L-malate synthase BshA